MRGLIITADDFGAARAVNEAVEIAHRSGVLTAASLMVTGPAAADAVARARRNPSLGVGLHLVLVEGRPSLPAAEVPDLVDGAGRFRNNMALAGATMFLNPAARAQLEAEVAAQFQAFAATGLALDHVNAHKHFHLHPTIASLILKIGARHGLRAARVPMEPRRVLAMAEPAGRHRPDPVVDFWAALTRRRFRRAGLLVPDQVFGLRWSGAMTGPRLRALIEHLPVGLSEIYLHPATAGGFEGAAAGYRYAEELAALIAPEVMEAAEAGGARRGGFVDFLDDRTPTPWGLRVSETSRRPRFTRGRLAVALAAVLGLALATAVIGAFGLASILAALLRIGWRGLVFLTAYSIFPLTLLGTAWFVLTPGATPRRWPVFVWARTLRDAATEVLPFSQLGGFVIGARAAILHGVTPVAAFSTTVVDVTTELIAQLGFTGLGVAMLAMRLSGGGAHGGLIGAACVGLALSAAGAAAFIAAQRRGMGLVEGLARRFLPAAMAGAGAVGQALNALYERPLRLAAAVLIHLAAWIASAAGAWIALRLAGVGIGLADVLALEALVTAVRSAAFVAPMGVGVQEATYALIGPLLGLPAEMSLALSLIKRARDLAVGLPALLVWQALEGHRLVKGGPDEDDLTGH